MKDADAKPTPDLVKEIERKRVDIARTLKPHIQTHLVTDGNTGKKYDEKMVKLDVVMNGTEQEFQFADQVGFSKSDSVMVTVNGDTAETLRGTLIGKNKVRVNASGALTNQKIKILMIGR
jgi:hypothetical protein